MNGDAIDAGVGSVLVGEVAEGNEVCLETGTGDACGVAAGAVIVLVGVGFTGVTIGGWEEEATFPPFSRLIRIGAEVLPAKNSLAESAASEDGAGGKMSD
jgi:hypothetical protein